MFLKKKLDDHVAHRYNGKVKVVHAAKREGLIRTRLLGAKAATGQVLIFLDSHVESNTNWLPPLLGELLDIYRYICNNKATQLPEISHQHKINMTWLSPFYTLLDNTCYQNGCDAVYGI